MERSREPVLQALQQSPSVIFFTVAMRRALAGRSADTWWYDAGLNKVQKMKKGTAVLLAMMLMPRLSLAEWKIEGDGVKVMSLPQDRIGTIAKIPAKAASYGVTAYLQMNASNPPSLRKSISP